LSAIWLRRCSISMTSLRMREWVDRVSDAHIDELRAGLECGHENLGYSHNRERRTDLQMADLGLSDLPIVVVNSLLQGIESNPRTPGRQNRPSLRCTLL